MTYKYLIQNAEITKSCGAANTLYQETHDNKIQNAFAYIFLSHSEARIAFFLYPRFQFIYSSKLCKLRYLTVGPLETPYQEMHMAYLFQAPILPKDLSQVLRDSKQDV